MAAMLSWYNLATCEYVWMTVETVTKVVEDGHVEIKVTVDKNRECSPRFGDACQAMAWGGKNLGADFPMGQLLYTVLVEENKR
jgi:hypothetical protein